MYITSLAGFVSLVLTYIMSRNIANSSSRDSRSLSDAEFYGFAMPTNASQKVSVLFQNSNGHATTPIVKISPLQAYRYQAINNIDHRNSNDNDSVTVTSDLAITPSMQQSEYQSFVSWIMMTSNRYGFSLS